MKELQQELESLKVVERFARREGPQWLAQLAYDLRRDLTRWIAEEVR